MKIKKKKKKDKKYTYLFMSEETTWRAASSWNHYLGKNKPVWTLRSCLTQSYNPLRYQGSVCPSHLPKGTEPTAQISCPLPIIASLHGLTPERHTMRWSRIPVFLIDLLLKPLFFFFLNPQLFFLPPSLLTTTVANFTCQVLICIFPLSVK